MRLLQLYRIFGLLAALAFNLYPVLSGQSFTSSITGLVTDPSGGAVVAAQVELMNMGTNGIQNFTTTNDGSYQFNNLGPGTYQITVTAPGFKKYVKSNLILSAQVSATVNIPLEVGGTEQKVEVTGSAVLVDTETANSSAILDSRLISALPNGTRNPLNFVFAVAGTTEGPAGATQRNGTFDQNASSFGLNGGRTGEESILIDGAPATAIDWGGLMVSPLQDSVQEQQIVTNTYDAQYERGGSGIVTLVTKGGTNTFHGEAYDYLQNSALNANSWSNNKYGAPKGQFKRNQFGGNVSGPILKRANLFFFGGYEGLRQPNTEDSGLQTVPTQAQRNGDFSASLNADGTPNLIYNPFTTAQLPDGTYTRQPFAGNVIPKNLINPVGAKMMSLYPLPNRPGQGPNQINNFFAQGAANSTNDKMDTRVDWEQSSLHRVFVRWSDRFRQDLNHPCFFCTGADSAVNEHDNGFQVVLNDTVTPSPTWVIDTFISYSRWQEAHVAQSFGVADASTIGLSPSLFQAPILPGISVENYAGLGVTFGGGFQKYTRYSNTIGMNITKQFSKHTLKFGGNFDDQRINNTNESNGVNTGSAAFSFGTALTSCDPNSNGGPCLASNSGSSVSGNALASMLLGTAGGGGQSFNIDPAMGIHIFGAYIQDQWRVTPRLTVNVGIRYENQRPATERFNRLEYFNTTAVNPISRQLGFNVLGGFEYAGVNGNDRYAWPPNDLDFAPRAGIAFKITDRLVARAGAGIYFLPASAMLSFDNPGQFYGFSSSTSYNATAQNGYVPLNLVNNPFPNGINQPTGSSQGLLTLVGDGQSQIWPKAPHPTPYTEQWSFDLQYQLSSHSVFQIGYLGNRGRKLLYGNPNINANQLPGQFLRLQSQLDQQVNNPFFGVLDPSTPLGSQSTIAYNQLLRPFPEFTYIGWNRSLPGARSSYNALDVKYNHRFGADLSVLMTYRWSKALDNGPEDFLGWATGNQWRDSYNTMLDYNISTHDVPQSFATALVYDLPYGRGKHWGNNAPGIVKEALGNWQLSSVVRLASGLPLPSAVFWSYNNPLGPYGFPGPQLANLVGNPVPSARTPNTWINAAAYTAPASPWTIGNVPQRMTQLRERAARNVDLSVAKNFGGERYQAWLRAEFLNAFNYAQYNLSPFNSFPLCVTCGDFGDLNSTENSPRTIQLSLKLMF
ncbi:MAG: TonB-dependent receptor [Acidobacteriaceae bacterium]|nr:TonB-dependent receptor [Acidobacteriaceae bacterium]